MRPKKWLILMILLALAHGQIELSADDLYQLEAKKQLVEKDVLVLHIGPTGHAEGCGDAVFFAKFEGRKCTKVSGTPLPS